MFHVIPATQNCRGILDRRGHLLLGISPFNSRFSDQYVWRLIDWAQRHCDRFDVLLAGEEAALLLEALGTPAGQARRKSRKAITRNRRSVREAFNAHGISGFSERVHTFSDFQDSSPYTLLRKTVDEAFHTDRTFHDACLDLARQAINGRALAIHSTVPAVTVESVERAGHYVLAELPFFLNTPAILGTKESLLVYHRPWRMGEQILAGELPLKVSRGQGYVTVLESADGHGAPPVGARRASRSEPAGHEPSSIGRRGELIPIR